MGVKGLANYLKQQSKFLGHVHLAEEVEKRGGKACLVLDGMNIVFLFFRKMTEPGDVLGDVIQLEMILVDFLVQFMKIGIEVHIFFDGVPDSTKKDTIDFRKRERISQVNRFVESIGSGIYPNFMAGVPLNLKFAFISAFYLYGENHPVIIDGCDEELVYNHFKLMRPTGEAKEVVHRLISSQDEADSNMARYANSLKDCIGIVSNDTDFIIFPNPGLIFADCFTPELIQDLRSATVKIYESKHVAATMGINHDHLPLLGLLTGNDVFDPKKEILPFAPEWWYPCHTIQSVINFLKQNHEKTIDEIFAFISVFTEQPTIVEKLSTSLRMGYESIEVDFRKKTEEIGVPRLEDQKGFWDTHFAALLGTTSLSIILTNEVGWPNVIEDFMYLSPFEVCEELDTIASNVLFGHLTSRPTIKCDARIGSEPHIIMKDMNEILKDVPYVPPIWDFTKESDTEKIHRILIQTSYPSPLIESIVGVEFTNLIATLRWICKKADAYRISELELNSLIISCIALAYGVSHRIKKTNPGLSVRGIQVASLFNAAISKMSLISLMYGLPGGWKSIIMSRQYDASLFLTCMQEDYQLILAQQTSHAPGMRSSYEYSHPMGHFLRSRVDIPLDEADESQSKTVKVAISNVFIAWKAAVLDQNIVHLHTPMRYSMVYPRRSSAYHTRSMTPSPRSLQQTRSLRVPESYQTGSLSVPAEAPLSLLSSPESGPRPSLVDDSCASYNHGEHHHRSNSYSSRRSHSSYYRHPRNIHEHYNPQRGGHEWPSPQERIKE